MNDKFCCKDANGVLFFLMVVGLIVSVKLFTYLFVYI